MYSTLGPFSYLSITHIVSCLHDLERRSETEEDEASHT